MASQKLSIEQKKSYRQNLSFFIGPDPKNEALDPKIEVSGPKNKNISNQKLGLILLKVHKARRPSDPLPSCIGAPQASEASDKPRNREATGSELYMWDMLK